MNGDIVVLVGLMGTGKTTVGQLLADKLGWSFVDTDAMVEERQGTTIQELFKQRGEPFFRALETEALREALDGRQRVVATGGGIVLAETNRRLMRQHGYVVALTADRDTIIERVKSNTDRPLLHGDLQARVDALMEQRKDAYLFADYTVATDGLTAEAIVLNIEQNLRAGAVQHTGEE